ncbi:MAG: hypothetical protein U9R73_09015 [Pseudomonadota bacterium]|nr:hypothetical protein [Pseudomonadota bacterium]
MITADKYPAKSGQGRFSLRRSTGGRDGAQTPVFAGIPDNALRACFAVTEVSGRIRPNPAKTVGDGRDSDQPANDLNSRGNFSAARLALAPIRPYPANGAYGRQ